MEFEQLLRERYACRKFSGKKVEKELLDKVLEAARLAPTAKNQQPFKIYVLESEESLKKVDQVSPCRYGAPVVLAFVYDVDEMWKNPNNPIHHSGVEDVAIVATHAMLEAKNIGLDTCWVKYFDNEEDNPGNWSLTWTFDPKDIPEDAVKEDLLNPLFHPHFKAISAEKFGMMFTGDAALVNIMTFCIEQLYKWLDENAKKGEDVEITLDGVFTAKVQVEDVNGEEQKVFAIIPAGEVKTMIKDDVSIEK